MIGEFFRFGVTGGLGTVTNLAVFFVFVDLLGLPAVPVSAGCFLVAGTQNYFLNHLWSFKRYTSGEPPSFRRWLTYLLGSLFGLAVNILVLKGILVFFDPPFKLIPQAAGILAGMMINFVISKFLIFRKRAAVPHPRPDTPAKPAA